MIRIYFDHKYVDRPYGGSNNFMKALHGALKQTGQFKFTDDIKGEYDLLFINEFKRGVGNPPVKSYARRLREIENARAESSGRKKIVVRVVNLKRHSYRFGFLYWLKDALKIKLTNTADMVIFQSNYQKGFFTKYGYKGKNNVVIHNGADDSVFNDSGSSVWDGSEKLKIISVSIGERITKRHDIIAKVSQYNGVGVSYIGNWPSSVEKKNVKLLGVLEREQVADILKSSHVFLHPAVKDVCPNVVFEAICCGLPVIYNDRIGSSKEVVQDNGLAINEDNVEETIQRVKESYPQLKENIKQTRSYYSINRAADGYIRVFTEVAGL